MFIENEKLFNKCDKKSSHGGINGGSNPAWGDYTRYNRPRATKQGCIKCKRHITVPAVPTQEAISEEGG